MTELQNNSFPSLSLSTADGNLQAYSLVADLMNPFFDLNLEIQENYGKGALEAFQGSVVTSPNEIKYLARNKNIKRGIEKKSTDLFSKLNSYTVNQLKNQAIRFGLEGGDHSIGTPRPSWGLKGLMGGNQAPTNAGDSREYEDVLSAEILQAPICDICIIQAGEAVPEGFYRLYKSPQNKKANLNSASGGNGIYLCVKKDLTGQIAPITNLIVLFPDRNENIPPGYHMIPRGSSACNINTGTGAERIYLCYKKDFLSNPITDLQVIFPAKGETPPKSFHLIDKSVSGLSANLNLGTGGAEIFLTYRQDLVRLWCLLNEVDPEIERAKRRFTKEELALRRSSISDGLMIAATRSRSRSPVPRGRFGSGVNQELSQQAKHALLESPPPVAISPSFNSADIDEELAKVRFAQTVVVSDSKLDELQDLEQLEGMDEWPELPEEI